MSKCSRIWIDCSMASGYVIEFLDGDNSEKMAVSTVAELTKVIENAVKTDAERIADTSIERVTAAPGMKVVHVDEPNSVFTLLPPMWRERGDARCVGNEGILEEIWHPEWCLLSSAGEHLDFTEYFALETATVEPGDVVFWSEKRKLAAVMAGRYMRPDKVSIEINEMAREVDCWTLTKDGKVVSGYKAGIRKPMSENG